MHRKMFWLFVLQCFYFPLPICGWSLIQVSLPQFYQRDSWSELAGVWLVAPSRSRSGGMTWHLSDTHRMIWILCWTTEKIFLSGGFLLTSVIRSIPYSVIKSRRLCHRQSLLGWHWVDHSALHPCCSQCPRFPPPPSSPSRGLSVLLLRVEEGGGEEHSGIVGTTGLPLLSQTNDQFSLLFPDQYSELKGISEILPNKMHCITVTSTTYAYTKLQD